MAAIHFFLLAISGLLHLATALPSPHKGMVDTTTLRDVGMVYSEPEFRGANKSIFEIKAAPECLPLNTNVMSVAVCKTDVACTFYTGGGCARSSKNYAVRVGCGDVKEVKTPKGSYFTHYRCGHAGVEQYADMTLDTTPHDSSKDGVAMRR